MRLEPGEFVRGKRTQDAVSVGMASVSREHTNPHTGILRAGSWTRLAGRREGPIGRLSYARSKVTQPWQLPGAGPPATGPVGPKRPWASPRRGPQFPHDFLEHFERLGADHADAL